MYEGARPSVGIPSPSQPRDDIATEAVFSSICGITVDKHGNLLVCDRNCIRKIHGVAKPSNKMTRLAHDLTQLVTEDNRFAKLFIYNSTGSFKLHDEVLSIRCRTLLYNLKYFEYMT